jgi:hypothetical protein
MVFKWTDEKLAEEAKKYKTRMEFKAGGKGAYCSASSRGKDFLDSICQHMAARNWSDEELQSEAKKYATRNEFREGSSTAYNIAGRRGKAFFESICSHMSVQRKRWKDEELQQVASGYKTRVGFQKGSNSAYQLSKRKGKDFLDKICEHMVEGSGGFKRSRGGFLYQFRIVLADRVYYKVGISNYEAIKRSKSFGIKEGVSIEQTHSIWYDCGDACRKAEKTLHQAAKENGLQYIGKDLMKNGFTEIFTKPLLQ